MRLVFNDVYNTMTDDDGDGVYSVTVLTDRHCRLCLRDHGFADQENLINDMVDGHPAHPSQTSQALQIVRLEVVLPPQTTTHM